VGAKDALFDLLDLEANLLTVRGVEQEACHRLPLLKRNGVPLLVYGAERVQETAEDLDSISIVLGWLSDRANSIKGLNANLPEYLVDFLELLRSANLWSCHVAHGAYAAALLSESCGCHIRITVSLPQRRQISGTTNEAVTTRAHSRGHRSCRLC